MTHQLAHNFLRLADWEHSVLKHSAYIAPNTTAAWNMFIDTLASTYEVKTDQPFITLGDILLTSGQAILSAIAYDPTFNAILFSEQFIKAYVPGIERRTKWLGAHPIRLRCFLNCIGIGIGTGRKVTDGMIDAYLRDTIRHELLAVNSAFARTYDAFKDKIDTVDPSVLEEKRQTVLIV